MPNLDRETERRLAAGLQSEVWRLLDLPKRRPEQDDELLHAAHASRYHWGKVGSPIDLARGEWLCSRTYSVLGRSEPAIWHALRCLELLVGFGGGQTWDEASAYEALARAHALANDGEAGHWRERARVTLALVPDPETRGAIEADLATLR
ncbi:MAG TPA: hypothetical protein VF337_08620 [Candidatus Limnocylindrales bacterium]